MPIIKETFVQTNEKYNTGYALDEEEGLYFLSAVQGVPDGTIRQRECSPEAGAGKISEKVVPMRILLGTVDGGASKGLRTALSLIQGFVFMDDVPF